MVNILSDILHPGRPTDSVQLMYFLPAARSSKWTRVRSRSWGRVFFRRAPNESTYVQNNVQLGTYAMADINTQGLLGKIPDFIINVMRHELWRGVMDHFLRYDLK
jgi:hypothetical protein